MPNQKLTFIIGAGASKEAGLPIGNELVPIISRLLNIRFEDGYRMSSGDHKIYEAIKLHCTQQDIQNTTDHLRAARKISGALPLALSIDNFIDAHRGDKELELCGKLAIVRAILEAERKSVLFEVKDHKFVIDPRKTEHTWFLKFFQALTENCRVEDLEDRFSKIKLIIFNYDRCIEHYLHYTLQAYYGINEKATTELMQCIEIYHPYGSVGRLEWQNECPKSHFGEDPDIAKLLDLANQIRTFTEGIDPLQSNIQLIRKSLSQADTTIFLGFSYLNQNLRLLGLIGRIRGSKITKHIGTAYGISDSDCMSLTEHLGGCCDGLGGKAVVKLSNNHTCSSIFHEYSRDLSLS